MSEDERTRFELEYWRLILKDVQDLSTQIQRAAEAQIEVPVVLATALLMPEAERGEQLLVASHASRETMTALLAMGAPLERLVQLVGGRIDALGKAD